MGNKKLLFVGPWPPPFGGIASHLYELLPGMVGRGYNIITLSYTDETDELDKVERGVRNMYFSPSVFFKSNSLNVAVSALTNLRHRKGLSVKKYIRALAIAKRINQIIEEEEKSSDINSYPE